MTSAAVMLVSARLALSLIRSSLSTEWFWSEGIIASMCHAPKMKANWKPSTEDLLKLVVLALSARRNFRESNTTEGHLPDQAAENKFVRIDRCY